MKIVKQPPKKDLCRSTQELEILRKKQERELSEKMNEVKKHIPITVTPLPSGG